MLAKLLLEDLDVMLLDEPTNFLDLEHIEWLRKFLDSYKGTFILVSHDTVFLNAVCKIIINIENGQIKNTGAITTNISPSTSRTRNSMPTATKDSSAR